MRSFKSSSSDMPWLPSLGIIEVARRDSCLSAVFTSLASSSGSRLLSSRSSGAMPYGRLIAEIGHSGKGLGTPRSNRSECEVAGDEGSLNVLDGGPGGG